MSLVNFVLNGKPCQIEAGTSVLQAALANGVEIPNLCYDQRLEAFGSCMLCRVEIDGSRGNPLACATNIAEGMVITTESPDIADSRRVCLELLLSEHTGDCVAPCTVACPAHIDVHHYIELIAQGQFLAALRLIKEQNPLPSVCGRVCTRPCEDECRRNIVDETVGINHLKRFVSDYDRLHGPFIPELQESTGKKIAIIGAGPAGLSCAYYSAIFGHQATIFEKHEKPGGMLRYGIPSYRLPREILDFEVGIIEEMGVKFNYGVEFGKDITYQQLKEEGFDAIFVGVGSQKGWELGCAGEDSCSRIYTGVDFLARIEKYNDVDLTGLSVMVVGAGNTAIDASRTALRLGASRVQMIYRRGRAEMPAHPEEVNAAEAEGVEIVTLTNPSAVAMDGESIAVTLIDMALGEPDASGRCRPVPIEGSEHMCVADIIIAAVGQTQDLAFINDDFPLEMNRDNIKASLDTAATNLPDVFAGGDAVTGPATAIEAIAAGAKGARSINRYLMNLPQVKEDYNHVMGTSLSKVSPEYYKDEKKKAKNHPKELSPKTRIADFAEVESTFTEEQAIAEALRCLSCGCGDADDCLLRKYSTVYDAQQAAFVGDKHAKPLDETNPVFVRDPKKCILCGTCVRVCRDVAEVNMIAYMYRGSHAETVPYLPGMMEGEKACVNCRLCVEACPTGALLFKKE
ncbi:MAG: FAD-dependent oxidoreductase [Firmicutes bacterium]|jgi:formate dehydrogenase major subunit|nr:FAD-dependent oxidoreductase [Bacillota bacterium]